MMIISEILSCRKSLKIVWLCLFLLILLCFASSFSSSSFDLAEMAPFYQNLCVQFKWRVDENLLKSLKSKNEAELKSLDAKIDDAVQNLGETEVRDAYHAKAKFFARIGDKVRHPFPNVKPDPDQQSLCFSCLCLGKCSSLVISGSRANCW